MRALCTLNFKLTAIETAPFASERCFPLPCLRTPIVGAQRGRCRSCWRRKVRDTEGVCTAVDLGHTPAPVYLVHLTTLFKPNAFDAPAMLKLRRFYRAPNLASEKSGRNGKIHDTAGALTRSAYVTEYQYQVDHQCLPSSSLWCRILLASGLHICRTVA